MHVCLYMYTHIHAYIQVKPLGVEIRKPISEEHRWRPELLACCLGELGFAYCRTAISSSSLANC